MMAQKEKGQVLALVVVVLVVLIAMTALIIDGGVLLSSRGQARAAADAGALAGGRILCEKNTNYQALAISTAVSYATQYATQDTANTATASVAGNLISVTATVSRDSFFAKMIGVYTLSSSAPATAACVIPVLGVVLPFAWYCPDTAGMCGVDMFSWKSGVTPTSTLYILSFDLSNMGDSSMNRTCSTTTSSTTMKCVIPATSPYVAVTELGDKNNMDVIVRDVCGNPGNVGKCISDNSTNLLDPTKNPYAAFPGKAENYWKHPSSYFTRSDGVYLLPAYNSAAHYTLASNAGFKITCVNDASDGGACPGAVAWYQANKGTHSINAGYTIEGYFIKNYEWDLTGPGRIDIPNLGAYIVSLTQ